MSALLKIAGVFDRIARSVGVAVAWIVMPLIFVIMFDVVTRKTDFIRLYFAEFTMEYGYSVSTILQDLEWHLHGVLMLLTFGFGYLMNTHIRVDIFRETFSRKGQALAELVGLLVLALPFMSLMLYFSWIFVAMSFRQGEGSESLTGIPWRYVIKGFLVIGFSMVLLAIFATLARLVVYLFAVPDDKRSAHQALAIFAYEDKEVREREEAMVTAELSAHSIRHQMRASAEQERQEVQVSQHSGGR